MPNTKGRRPGRLTEPSDLLRAAGLRRTAPRISVLNVLGVAVTPLSRDEIARTIATCDERTVHCNLADLVDAGIVTRTDWGDRVTRFELPRPRRKPSRLRHGSLATSPSPRTAAE
jgi:Fur family ferric uptake transcriptional regulator